MKNFASFAIALAALAVIPNTAFAGDNVADRNAAIQLCRAEVTAQAGTAAQVRLDQIRMRPNIVRVDFDVWRNGQLQNVRCDVDRGETLTIAQITPPLQATASAQ